jgi:hypothetical protein
MSLPTFAADVDLDNDGRTDYQFGGSDRDLDNDGKTDHGAGGNDRDLDNDHKQDFGAAGMTVTLITTIKSTRTRAAGIRTWTTMGRKTRSLEALIET